MYVLRMFAYLFAYLYVCAYIDMYVYVWMDGWNVWLWVCDVYQICDGFASALVCMYSAWLQLVIPYVRYSEGSLFRRFVSPKI